MLLFLNLHPVFTYINAVHLKINYARLSIKQLKRTGDLSLLMQVWNAELESIAQRLADQCIFAHDSVRYGI